MSKDQYLLMCEETGEDIDWEKCPPEWNDFPTVVVDAMNIFHSLGDRIYPEIGYIGKDYTNFNFLLQQYSVEEHQKDYIFDLIMTLDSRRIEASQKKLKAEYDKIKRKK